MSSNKFLSKALNAVSALALSGVLLGSSFLTSAQAMLAAEDEEYNTRSALSKSPLQHLDDSFFLGEIWRLILNDSSGDNTQPGFHIACRHFHKLSCHENFKRTLTLNTREQVLEILASRNPIRQKGFEEGKHISGYALPYPQSICLALDNSLSLKPMLKAYGLEIFFGRFPLLTSLDLKNYCVKGKRAKVLEQYLSKTSCLKSLNIEGNTLFKGEMTHLAEGLSKNTSLTSLTLGNVEWEGSLLFNAINTHSTLKSLSLNDNMNFSFSRDIFKQCTSLTSLHFVWKIFDFPLSTRKIFPLLPHHPSLKTVGFLSKEMKVKEVQMLADALKQTSSLTSLNLSGLDPEAGKRITGVCKEQNIYLKWEQKKAEVVTPTAVMPREFGPPRVFYNNFSFGGIQVSK